MAIPHGMRFPDALDDLFPQGAYLMGDIQPLTEYQSQEERAVRATGLRAVDAPASGRGSAKSAGGETGKSAA